MTDILRGIAFRIEGQRVVADVWYDANRPLTLGVTFPDCNTWTFARDLAVDGLNGVAGLGDVCCWRSGTRLHMSLTGPDGRAVMWCLAADMEAFLAATFAVVPAGCEVLDFDADLDLLLLAGGAR
jgi:hypothetical protein